MATQIKEFRTQKFKDVIVTIATQKGYNKEKYDTLKYNFDNDGNIKKLTINKVSDEYVAILKTEKYVDDSTHTIYIGITYGDYLEFTRNVKVSEVLGDKIIVKSSRKVIKKADATFEPKVGDKLHYGNKFDGTNPCKVVKRTPKSVTIEQTFLLNNNELYTREILLKLNDGGLWGDYSDHLFQEPHQQTADSKFLKENPMCMYN